MALPRLRRPDQPLPVRWALGLFECCASVKLAVCVILGSACVLGAATVVEGSYGIQAVQFGMYGTWWFAALNGLLALNIFCAAAIRYPWKRHQTGFVITHIGLLTLLFGCLLSRRGGIDAQMPILEGDHSRIAYEDSQSFELVQHRAESDPRETDATTKSADLDRTADDSSVQLLASVPFRGGPFNWQDYARLPWWLPLRYASTDRGTLYDRDGVRLDVLDYYSHAENVRAPRLELRLSVPRQTRMNAAGREELGPQIWQPVVLDVVPAAGLNRPLGIGRRKSIGGGAITFSIAASEAEVAAFLDSGPMAPIRDKGQIVLHAIGKKYALDVAQRLGKGPQALGDSDLQVEVVRWVPTAMQLFSDEHSPPPESAEQQSPAVELRITRGTSTARLQLFADEPELNEQATAQDVFGSYWFDHGEKTSEQLMAGEGRSRIDILQGPNDKLVYRYWNRSEVALSRELPTTDQQRVPAFKMPMGQLEMYVKRHISAPRPEVKVLHKEFSSKMVPPAAVRAARLRLTVDGHGEEFWLLGFPPTFDDKSTQPEALRFVEGRGRTVSVKIPLDRIDVGFQVKLRDFERTLDPGTSQPASYSSLIDVLDPDDAEKALHRDVRITMNAPVDYIDPRTKRSYRLFQESFFGPITPDDPLYGQRFPHGDGPENWYQSTLTVNYDPGRGIKYLGCMLIVSGIATMFYMRAYFFKPVAPSGAAAELALPSRRRAAPKQLAPTH